MTISKEEIQALAEDIAEVAADRAIEKFMIASGLENDPLKRQAMFLHLERQYDACQTIKQHSLKTAIGVVVTAIAGYVLMMFSFPKLK